MMDSIIDIRRNDITQPETTISGYPTEYNLSVIKRFVNLNGSIIGYEKDGPVWNPVITWNSNPPSLAKTLIEWLDEVKFSSPGITCYLCESQENNTQSCNLWGILYIEDWYENCIDYQSEHISRGDPSAWSIITEEFEQKRGDLQNIITQETGMKPVTVRNQIKDNHKALFGQVQLLFIKPSVFQNMTTRIEIS